MFHFHSPVAKQKGSMPHHSMAVNNIIIFNYPWIIGAFRLIVASHPIAFAKGKKFQNLFKWKGNRAVFKQIISPLPKKFSLSLTRRRVLKNQRRRRRQISLFIANIKMFTLERVPANRESNNNRNINSIMITRQDELEIQYSGSGSFLLGSRGPSSRVGLWVFEFVARAADVAYPLVCRSIPTGAFHSWHFAYSLTT